MAGSYVAADSGRVAGSKGNCCCNRLRCKSQIKNMEGKSMSVIGVDAIVNSYAAYGTQNGKAVTSDSKAEDTKETASAKEEAVSGAVYEKSTQESDTKASYKVNKMSAEDREALVQQLKQDQENRQNQLLDIVNKMISGQASTFGQATFGSVDDDFWKFLAKGDFTVDEETKAQAQKDIADDGYWGVEQTASRIFDFASALAGDDVDQMKKMQEAFTKGFKEAEKVWGNKLPDISYKTQDAVSKKFEDYYNSKDSVSQKTGVEE